MHQLCPECGSKKIAHEINEYYCGKCGFVVEETVFVGS